MRLCSLLGIPSTDLLKQILTHEQYIKWLRFYQVDPWDQDRADLRAAQIAAATLAPHTKRTPKPADFMLFAKNPTKPKTEAQMRTILEFAAKSFDEARKGKAKNG